MCFRYLEKYVGMYTVLPPVNPVNNLPAVGDDIDDLYIPVRHGQKAWAGIKATDTPGILCVMYLDTRKWVSIYNRLEKEDLVLKLDDLGEEKSREAIIYFKEEDLKKVAKIVGAGTKGKNKAPFGKSTSVKPLKYKIPDADKKKKDALIATCPLEGSQRRVFSKRVMKEFMKKKELTELAKQSDYRTEEFIHSVKMYDSYLRYLKKAIEQL